MDQGLGIRDQGVQGISIKELGVDAFNDIELTEQGSWDL